MASLDLLSVKVARLSSLVEDLDSARDHLVSLRERISKSGVSQGALMLEWDTVTLGIRMVGCLLLLQCPLSFTTPLDQDASSVASLMEEKQNLETEREAITSDLESLAVQVDGYRSEIRVLWLDCGLFLLEEYAAVAAVVGCMTRAFMHICQYVCLLLCVCMCVYVCRSKSIHVRVCVCVHWCVHT